MNNNKSDFSILLKQAASDQIIHDEEWSEIEAKAVELDASQIDETAALLDVYQNDQIALSDKTALQMRTLLRNQGFDLPGTHRNLGATNVQYRDHDFQQLLKMAEVTPAPVTIGVADFDIDQQHLSFAKQLKNSYDFSARKNSTTTGKSDHGTGAAGIALRGLPYADLVVTRTMTSKQLVEGIDHLAKHGAKIISISLLFYSKKSHPRAYALTKDDTMYAPWREGIREVVLAMQRHSNILFTVAAGNHNRQIGVGGVLPGEYLAAHVLPNLLVVAAADKNGAKASYSDYGSPYVTVAAPADHYTPGSNSLFQDYNGTSGATPYVANIAAKCVVLSPDLSETQLRNLLVLTSDPSEQWKGLVWADGTVSKYRAMRVAAFTGLLRRGRSPEEAAKQLHFSKTERDEFAQIANRLGP